MARRAAAKRAFGIPSMEILQAKQAKIDAMRRFGYGSREHRAAQRKLAALLKEEA